MIGALVSTGRRRDLAAGQHRALVVAAALFSAWVIYANLFTISDPLVLGILFVSGIYAIMFVAIGATPHAPDHVPIYDIALSLLSLASGIFFFVNSTAIADRISLLDPFTPAQLFFGFSLLLLTLEATRRTTGMGLTIVVLAFLAYNWFGYLLPPPFGHGVDNVNYLLDILVFTTDGVFGVPIQVVASYVFLFVMFGTFLSKAGGGEFFFNLAALLTGRARGGPAKIAVISSGLYGTMSGSPTSDVVATGSITIPVMKRLGYSARFAAAVEVAASTGGSAMPPVMGSAAFILAEYTGIDYKAVVVAAVVPALLYYLGVFSQVHLRAVRDDLRPSEDEMPTVAQTLRTGWVFLLPIIGIVVALLSGYSPTFTAGIGVIGVVIASMILKATRMSPWQIIEGLGDTTLRILPVAGACAAAGLVIGGLSMTGLGMKAANLILVISSSQPVLTLVIAAVVTIVLGLGMPTPSAYILAAVLVGPALAQLGYPVLESHMFLLYFAILSALTPPIAVAALSAAAIAHEDPFKIAFTSVKLAAIGFMLPFAFIWNPALMLLATPLSNALAVVGGVVATLAMAVAVEAFASKPVAPAERLLLAMASVAAIAPFAPVALAGIAAGLALLARHLLASRRGSVQQKPAG
ncbi:MAG: TRAP transporter fused permease subunit [Alphaproteobacteria bacterium]|nr:TRAP transporter fused permease subunit [Alphaproteobacteria bacterium]MBU1552063.1 TRAP transporter fused permease subunit [Alphaproteobacteria bacterium]MBU2337673.1 TRAP transporter fused permease subunit [Alphaproteobacteria bacterium]MBU2391513.1 TRAP transporter fused permease subunit [Alphaproteobacteria bacterium]